MPAVVVELKVVRFPQKPGLCGAATAQMILFYKGLIGNQVTDQDNLWTLIQGHTVGPRPTGVSIAPTDCPTWSEAAVRPVPWR